MAGPNKKFKIQIIKAGIGDPLIAACFQFMDESGFDNPEEYPVENMKIQISFNYLKSNGTWSDSKISGSAKMANFGTLNYYYLTFPFDQPEDINLDDTQINMEVIATSLYDSTSEEYYTVEFENGTPGTDNMTVTLTDEGTPVPFANLSVKYAYCPGGTCSELV